jgi:hypothetical protein
MQHAYRRADRELIDGYHDFGHAETATGVL